LIIILIFSLFNYALALYQQGTSMLSNSLSIIRLDPKDSFAHSTSYIGVYVPFSSPDGNVQVHFPNLALIQLFSDYVLQPEPATISASSNGTDINLPYADLKELNAFQVEQDLPVPGGLTSHLTQAHGTLIGTVTNTLPTVLSDAYLLMPHSIVRLGTLGPGQTSNIMLPLPGGQVIPTCGSLINQVTTSSGGLPAGYDRLFYHDINRSLSEKQRHVSFLVFLLDSLQCNLSPLGTADSPATLIGWADQSLSTINGVTINGSAPAGSNENLLQVPLDINLSALANTPPDLISAQVINAEGSDVATTATDVYSMTEGSITFEFVLPIEAAHVNNLIIREPFFSGSAEQVLLYNWSTSSWDTIALNQDSHDRAGAYITGNLKAYISPDGRVLLRQSNRSSAELIFSKPSLSLNV